jgi:proteic killer suppression protein
MAIQSFAKAELREFFEEGKVPKGAGWQGVKKIVARKLDMLHYAHALNDLKSPPGNQLEALKDDLKGWHSIRVNDQWRVVFEWTNQGPVKVQIRDYHY